MSASHGASIEQYHLERACTQQRPPCLKVMWKYMEAEGPVWQHFNIRHGTQIVSEYTVSPINQAYFSTPVDLSSLPEPTMKRWDMMVDNYKKAGGMLSTLRRIGVYIDTDDEVYQCIRRAFASKGLEFPAHDLVSAELYVETPVHLKLKGASESSIPLTRSSRPDEPGWVELTIDNLFISDQKEMLSEYRDELKDAAIDKIVAVVGGNPAETGTQAATAASGDGTIPGTDLHPWSLPAWTLIEQWEKWILVFTYLNIWFA
ncbi:Lethal(2) giant larvae sro7 [Hypoxylon texense]